MNNTSPINTIILVVILVLLGGGGIWWYKTYGPGAPQQANGINVQIGGTTNGQ